jgi:hypothetical protein
MEKTLQTTSVVARVVAQVVVAWNAIDFGLEGSVEQSEQMSMLVGAMTMATTLRTRQQKLRMAMVTAVCRRRCWRQRYCRW